MLGFDAKEEINEDYGLAALEASGDMQKVAVIFISSVAAFPAAFNRPEPNGVPFPPADVPKD
jgi:hypothetical protein